MIVEERRRKEARAEQEWTRTGPDRLHRKDAKSAVLNEPGTAAIVLLASCDFVQTKTLRGQDFSLRRKESGGSKDSSASLVVVCPSGLPSLHHPVAWRA
jgi:hypothetical protein